MTFSETAGADERREDKQSSRGSSLCPHLVQVASLQYLCHLSDNGLNGDLLSEDDRSAPSDLDGEDSMDSDKVGALNLVTTSPTDRLSNSSSNAHSENNNTSPLSLHHHLSSLGQNNHHNIHHRKNGASGNNNNNNNNNNAAVSNGHGPVSPPAHHHIAPSVQAALAALQAGQISLNQVTYHHLPCFYGAALTSFKESLPS